MPTENRAPFSALEDSGRSEPFRPDERHDEVDREGDGNDQPNESFNHRILLKPVQRACVERKQEEAADAGGKKKDVGHCMLQVSASRASIWRPCNESG